MRINRDQIGGLRAACGSIEIEINLNVYALWPMAMDTRTSVPFKNGTKQCKTDTTILQYFRIRTITLSHWLLMYLYGRNSKQRSERVTATTTFATHGHDMTFIISRDASSLLCERRTHLDEPSPVSLSLLLDSFWELAVCGSSSFNCDLHLIFDIRPIAWIRHDQNMKRSFVGETRNFGISKLWQPICVQFFMRPANHNTLNQRFSCTPSFPPPSRFCFLRISISLNFIHVRSVFLLEWNASNQITRDNLSFCCFFFSFPKRSTYGTKMVARLVLSSNNKTKEKWSSWRLLNGMELHRFVWNRTLTSSVCSILYCASGGVRRTAINSNKYENSQAIDIK